MKKRRDTSRPKRTEMVRIDRKEVKRLGLVARSYAPRGKLGAKLRALSDAAAVREIVYLVGSACGSAFGVWSEISVKVIALLLADVNDREAMRRTVRIWQAIEQMPGKKRQRIRREVVRGLRNDTPNRGASRARES